VPDPDISFRFLMQQLRILNRAAKNLAQRLGAAPFRLPVGKNFSSKNNGVSDFFRTLDQNLNPDLWSHACARSRFGYIPSSITPQANLQNEPENRFQRLGAGGGLHA
jgi:hypothetical protein